MASRNEASRVAILEAALELLKDTTVQKVSIEAIAKRAGVGKTTIYRWWPSKAAVVIDAFMENHLVKTQISQEGTVRDALETHMRALIQLYQGSFGRLVAQIIAEAQYDDRVRQLFLERFWLDRRTTLRTLLERGIENGDISAEIDDVDLLVEMLYAPIYMGLLFGHRPLCESYAERAVSLAFDGPASGPRRPKAHDTLRCV